ncbi:MAG: T9SS type A sorting domain-containing protein, partial [Bacteroidales bacterium]|nr:T9SS type A sorting domain-containing protein [Bacteroidales bacterium]
LNIRTGLKDARVDVFDLSGRMVYGREITENVTTINAEGWPSGTYVWKVIANGKEVESGKWIKQ